MSGLGDLLLRLRPWLPAVLLAAAAGTALLAWLLWRAARGPQAAAPGGAAQADEVEAPPAHDPAVTSADLRSSFSAAMSTLRRYVPGREFRYRIPWVLVLGEAGSGKTTALAGSGAERPFEDPGEDPLDAKQACRWSFFDRGVVLDVAGDLFLRAGGSGSDEWGWRTLLRLLRRSRPERPVDGVVLTVPCSTLYGRGALTREALASRGEAAFHKLWEAQKQLGLRFPVYVLVTGCDRVAGFRALCSALPAPLLDDAFGWSSPYPLERSFSPAWVDEAFASMDRELYEAQVELLGGAEPAPDPDGVFRFPGELARLRDPLRSYLHEVFRESAYNESFFFRGVYFTGDADAPLPALADEQGTAEEGAPAPSRPRRPVFLRRLLEDKVLAERGLVRPAATAALSRNRVVRAAQVALVLFPLAAVLAGWHSHSRIQRNSKQLVTTLREVETDLRRLHAERHDTAETDAREVWGDVHAYDLLQKMSDVGQRALWSFLLPSSWFSGLRSDVRESMTTAFNEVIFPAMRTSLLVRADSLLPEDPAAGPPPDGPEALEEYLRVLGGLSANVAHYNYLAHPDSADPRRFAALVGYLYGKELPSGSTGSWAFYSRALRSASQQPIEEDVTRRALDRADVLVGGSYDLLFERLDGLRMRAGSGGGAAAAFAGTGQGFGTIRDDITGVRGFFDDSEAYWLDPQAPLGARVRTALDSLRGTRFVDAATFRRRFEEGFRARRADRLQQIGEVLEPYAGGGAPADGGAAPGTVLALRAALDTLQRQSFAVAGDPVRVRAEVQPGYRLVWDVRQLDLALARERDYQRFVGRSLPGLSPGAQQLVQGLAAAQLEAGITAAAAGAMRQAPARPTYGQRGAERDLRERVAEFQPAGERLVQLAATLDRLGMDQSRDDLAAAALAQAAAMLAEADRLLDASGSYLPPDGFDAWDGSGSPALAAYAAATPDDLDAYLAAQQQRVRAVFDAYAAPLLAVMTASPLAPAAGAMGLASSPSVARWRSVDAALDGYDAKAPGNPLAALETFIRADLRDAAGGCARGRPGRGGDYFGQTLTRVRAAFGERCRSLAGSRAVAGYDRIQDAFQEELAGRFPFALPGSTAGEADPESVRRFFRVMDDHESAWRQVVSGAGGVGGAGSPQALFLEQLLRARAFLAPVLAGDTAAGPAYLVSPEFRANRGREAGADQIAAWTLEVGGARLVPRGADSVAGWRPGDPVRLSLRWATESPVAPAPAPGARVSGRTAAWGHGGGWALLRLLRQQAAHPGEVAAGAAGRGTLRFAVPTQPGGEARVFLRLRLLDPKTGAELPVPVFPTSAPPLRASRPAPGRAAPSRTALALPPRSSR